MVYSYEETFCLTVVTSQLRCRFRNLCAVIYVASFVFLEVLTTLICIVLDIPWLIGYFNNAFPFVRQDMDTEIIVATARGPDATAVSANVVVDERQMNALFLDLVSYLLL